MASETTDVAALVDMLANVKLEECGDVNELLTGPLLELYKATLELPCILPEDDTKWRRPHTKSPKSHVENEEDGNNSVRRIVVPCLNHHPLVRFATPSHGYTCDLCKKSQTKNTSMYGCRQCNWDACVPCHGKLYTKLKFERERAAAQEQASKPPEAKVKPDIELPPNTGNALLNGFGELRSNRLAACLLLNIAKNVSSIPELRNASLRDSIIITTNDHLVAPQAAHAGCVAIRNLLLDEQRLSTEEIDIIIELAKGTMEAHSQREDILSDVFGLLLTLHDISPESRTAVLSSGLSHGIVSAMKQFVESQEIIERGCGLLSRMPENVDSEGVLSFLVENVMCTQDADDDLYEQAYGALIAVCMVTNPKLLAKMIARASKARFGRV